VNILISGGTGYIGSRFADYLSGIGHRVTVATRKTKGVYQEIGKVKYVEVAWDTLDEASQLCQGIDVVINAAGMTSRESELNPTAALNLSKNVTKKLLNISENRIKRFIQLSTFHVYRQDLDDVINENSKTDSHLAYASQHLESEKLVIAATSFETTILRLSNVFGPPSKTKGDCWNLVVNQMCRDAVLNKSIRLKTTGRQTRNFLPISELTDGIAKIIGFQGDEKLPSIINFGGKTTISILDAAKIISSRCQPILGYTPTIITETSRPDETEFIFKFESIYRDKLPIGKPIAFELEIDSMLNYLIDNKVNNEFKFS